MIRIPKPRRLAQTIFATALAVVAVAGPVSADETADDLKKLEGAWTVPSGGGGEVVYTFKGDKLTVVAPSRTYKITVVIDAKAKPEKTIDFKIDEAPDDAKGKTSKGIYKFDGDSKAIVCFRPEGDRPEKYEMIGFEQILIEMKKKKD